MDKQKNNFFLKNSIGQSSVEYILLLAVVAFLGLAVIRSARFKEFFGDDSKFFKTIAAQMQYSYRHGRLGTTTQIQQDNYSYNAGHDTYKMSDKQASRFFLSLEKYNGN